jgi:hypothetical protein
MDTRYTKFDRFNAVGVHDQDRLTGAKHQWLSFIILFS